MDKDKYTTDVVFRKWKKSIIALFPYVFNDYNCTECMSYMHIGQHSGANYDGIIKNSYPATQHEYIPLKKELENIGYNLNVIKKLNYRKWGVEREKELIRLDEL